MSELCTYTLGQTIEHLIDGNPVIDVRAPAEFGKGALPGAINLPILNDEERRQVGTTYKHAGRSEAIELGESLVCGSLKQRRVKAWQAQRASTPDVILYCARGGLRSGYAAQWMAEANTPIPRVVGGFKSIRAHLLECLERSPNAIILSGCTGVGKTETLKRIDASIDLEGLANHRGSGFGRRIGGQPTQINFENRLAIQLLQAERAGHTRLVFEDESRRIGRIGLPPALFAALKQGPILLQTASIDDRINQIHREYTVEALQEHQASVYDEALVAEKRNQLPAQLQDEPPPFTLFAAELLRSLGSIQRRLGGLQYGRLHAMMADALALHATGDASGHRAWISTLLEVYYDPMYTYQINNKRDRIVFEGSQAECIEWCVESGLTAHMA